MGVLDLAAQHYRQQVTLARVAAVEAGRLWSQVDPNAIGPSWTALLMRLLAVLTGAQRAAAVAAGPYLDGLLDAYSLDKRAVGAVEASAFAGVASDGRDLVSLLYEPAVTSLTAIKRGATVPRAMAGGQLALDTIVRTQIADAGRAADGVALTARPQLQGYVRLLSPPSCSRCVLLAGRVYRWNQGFQRHPRCDCRHIPAPEDVAGDLRTDPQRYFDSLDPAEQDRVFGKAGAEAIRDGADLARVVNARRGMYTAAGRQLTSEATTRRGINRRIRLMPEQIYIEAGGNRDEAVRLLRLHGYIT